MAIPTWPLTLPQVPQKGYTESTGVNVIRSQTDMGPAKQRFRGKSASKLNVSFIMTTQQVDTFEAFVEDDLRGVLRFNFKHPRYAAEPTAPYVEVRIVPQGDKYYDIAYLAPGYWTVSTQFEVLP